MDNLSSASPVNPISPPPPLSSPDMPSGVAPGVEPNPPPSSYPKKALLILPLLIATFLLSFFFSASSRQPKTSSRAAIPSPTLSSSNLSHLDNLSSAPPPKSGFSSLISSPPISPISSPNLQSASPPSSSNPSSQKAAFSIVLENNSFTPKDITVYNNQIVTIDLFAKDKTYDITIEGLGLYALIPAGTHKAMDFQALNPGTFTFFCEKNCQNSPDAKGTLVIK